jgi:hypothetical protein
MTTILTATDEQQGMSPRLAQALSKALEEELTRELAPILDPIMDRIRAIIPSIIEKCRLELLRSPPEENISFTMTPAVVSAGSSDGEFWNRGKHCDSPPSSHSSRSSLDLSPITPDVMYDGELDKPPNFSTLSSDPFGEIGREDFTTFGCNTQPTLLCSTSQYEMPVVLKSDVFDAPATEFQGDLSLDPDSLFSVRSRAGTDDSFAMHNNTPDFCHGYYPGGIHTSNETLIGLACAGESTDINAPKGLQPSGSMFMTGDQQPLSTWDLTMKEFDFTLFSNG